MRHYLKLLAACVLAMTALTAHAGLFDDLGSALGGDAKNETSTPDTTQPPAQPTDKSTKNLAVKETGNTAKRVALVIGNDRYSTVPALKNAVADARSMATELKRAGFDVTLKTDANLDAMKLAVRQFKASLSGGDEAVFFYSGHGVQLGAANYLLPVNITSDNEEQVKDDAIPLQRLLDDLQDQKVKFALAIIDACRDNPFKAAGKRSIGGTRGLAATSAANGQMVIFSAGNGQQALDKLGDTDRDKNGVFTRVFLQEMQKPGLEVHQVVQGVRRRVDEMAKSVKHDQVPAMYDQVVGDFHFYPGIGQGTQTASLVPVPIRVKTKEEIEDDYWDDIKDSNDLASYEQYGKDFPEGRYLSSANIKIAQLKKKVQDALPVAPPPVAIQAPARTKKSGEEIEDDTWATAESANTVEAIKAYLIGYPKGRYVSQARVKLATLKTAPAAPQTVTPEAPAAPAGNRNDPDATLWAEAQKGSTVEDYQVYLDSYPKGKYLPFAKARIKKLNEAAQAAAEQQEQQAWDTAQQENSEASFSLYLKTYPTGRFAGLAKVRNDKLKNDLSAKEEAALWNKAASGNDKAAVEAYLNRYPSGRYLTAASAKLQAIREEEAKVKDPAMVRIPGRNYELGKYEVTQKEWREVMGSNPSHFSNCGDTCPVEQVSWNDIQTFLQKLNQKTGKQYRLPTEAEWEYACYGGSQSEYCGGNNLDAVGWYGNMGQPGGNSNQTTHPAGQKQANGYGLYDMSGNVWEWMENKYDNEHDWRVLRGGSWLNDPQFDRAANRYRNGPANRYNSIGFRLARTLP